MDVLAGFLIVSDEGTKTGVSDGFLVAAAAAVGATEISLCLAVAIDGAFVNDTVSDMNEGSSVGLADSGSDV